MNQLRKPETPVIIHISLNFCSPFVSKALFQNLHQTGICSSYHHVADMISDWAPKVLQVYKDSNQGIRSKQRGMVFTVFAKGNIDKNSKSNQATKHFHGTRICAFQSVR